MTLHLRFVGDRMGNPGYKLKNWTQDTPKHGSPCQWNGTSNVDQFLIYSVSIYHAQSRDTQHFCPVRRVMIGIFIPWPQRLIQRSLHRNLEKKVYLKCLIMFPTPQVREATYYSLAIIHHQNSTKFYVMRIHQIYMNDTLKRVLDSEWNNENTTYIQLSC